MTGPATNRHHKNGVPRVLVVLPTLGQRIDTFRETLASVDAQRRDVNLRLVVVAPPAAREARKLAESFGADVVDDPQSGISGAINRGIDARAGEEFYAWMGDDDLFRPGGLKALVTLFDIHPDAIVSYGGCDYINQAGQTIAQSRAGKWAQVLLPWGPDLIPHPGSMIRLDDLVAVGLFDPELKFAMDLDIFLKLRRRGKFVFTKDPVSAFRWHPSSLTVGNRKLSSAESERVKARYLPPPIRPFRFLWDLPIRAASLFASRALSSRA